jgi:hypothetical protein
MIGGAGGGSVRVSHDGARGDAGRLSGREPGEVPAASPRRLSPR